MRSSLRSIGPALNDLAHLNHLHGCDSSYMFVTGPDVARTVIQEEVTHGTPTFRCDFLSVGSIRSAGSIRQIVYPTLGNRRNDEYGHRSRPL
jgi:hypothetical protein